MEVEVDQYLKRGFPVKTLHVEGSYISGTSINALVGNIDADPKLEILASGHAAGPVYAWHADGSEVAGWPAFAGWLGTVGYPSLGEFDPASPGSEVVVGYFAGTDSSAAIYYGNGVPFPAWPRPLGSQGATMVADVDGNGIDDVFLGGRYEWTARRSTTTSRRGRAPIPALPETSMATEISSSSRWSTTAWAFPTATPFPRNTTRACRWPDFPGSPRTITPACRRSATWMAMARRK